MPRRNTATALAAAIAAEAVMEIQPQENPEEIPVTVESVGQNEAGGEVQPPLVEVEGINGENPEPCRSSCNQNPEKSTTQIIMQRDQYENLTTTLGEVTLQLASAEKAIKNLQNSGRKRRRVNDQENGQHSPESHNEHQEFSPIGQNRNFLSMSEEVSQVESALARHSSTLDGTGLGERPIMIPSQNNQRGRGVLAPTVGSSHDEQGNSQYSQMVTDSTGGASSHEGRVPLGNSNSGSQATNSTTGAVNGTQTNGHATTIDLVGHYPEPALTLEELRQALGHLGWNLLETRLYTGKPVDPTFDEIDINEVVVALEGTVPRFNLGAQNDRQSERCDKPGKCGKPSELADQSGEMPWFEAGDTIAWEEQIVLKQVQSGACDTCWSAALKILLPKVTRGCHKEMVFQMMRLKASGQAILEQLINDYASRRDLSYYLVRLAELVQDRYETPARFLCRVLHTTKQVTMKLGLEENDPRHKFIWENLIKAILPTRFNRYTQGQARQAGPKTLKDFIITAVTLGEYKRVTDVEDSFHRDRDPKSVMYSGAEWESPEEASLAWKREKEHHHPPVTREPQAVPELSDHLTGGAEFTQGDNHQFSPVIQAADSTTGNVNYIHTCGKCKTSEHDYRDCPYKNENPRKFSNVVGQGKPIPAQKRQEGYQVGKQPYAGANEPKTAHPDKFKQCGHCNKMGHIHRDCPVRMAGISEHMGKCYGCNELGHFRKNCPNKYMSRDPQGAQGRDRASGAPEPTLQASSYPDCDFCGYNDHLIKDCGFRNQIRDNNLTCSKCPLGRNVGHGIKTCYRMMKKAPPKRNSAFPNRLAGRGRTRYRAMGQGQNEPRDPRPGPNTVNMVEAIQVGGIICSNVNKDHFLG
jgi:hypothetical protein